MIITSIINLRRGGKVFLAIVAIIIALSTSSLYQTLKNNCTAGKFCPTGTLSPVDCPSGHYCPANSSTPTICPIGRYCGGNSITPTACQVGRFCPLGSSASSICPEGHYCPANSSTPTACPANTKSPVGSSLSSACINIAPSAFNSLTIDKYQIIWQGGGRECGRGTMTPGTYRVVLGGGRGGNETRNVGALGARLDHMFTTTGTMSYQICSGAPGGSGAGGGGSWLRLWNGTDINKVVAASDQYIVAGGGGGGAGCAGQVDEGCGGGGGGGIGGGGSFTCGGGGVSTYCGGASGPYEGGCRGARQPQGVNPGENYPAGGNICLRTSGGGGGGCGGNGGVGASTATRQGYGGSCISEFTLFKGWTFDRRFGGEGASVSTTGFSSPAEEGKATHPINTPDPTFCASCAKIYKLK